MPTVKSYQKNPIHENIRMFEMELRKKFPDLVITSGYRQGAKTKQGRPSRHAKGEAIDIRYNPEINDYLWNTKEGILLLNKYKLGFLDESDPETLKRTGGSAPHTHIGFDSTLAPKTKERYLELWGNEKPSNINPEQSNFEEINTFSSFEYRKAPHTRIGANLPTIKDIEEKTSEKQESTSKEKEALLQRQREYTFLQDLSKGIVQQQLEQNKEIRRPEVPQIDPLQEYEQISQFVENPIMQQGGKVPVSKNGVFDTNGNPVIVPSNQITMQGVNYPILGISQQTGEQKIMLPNVQNYFFKDTKSVLEIPLKQYYEQK